MFVQDHHTLEELQRLTKALTKTWTWLRHQAVGLAKPGNLSSRSPWPILRTRFAQHSRMKPASAKRGRSHGSGRGGVHDRVRYGRRDSVRSTCWRPPAPPRGDAGVDLARTGHRGCGPVPGAVLTAIARRGACGAGLGTGRASRAVRNWWCRSMRARSHCQGARRTSIRWRTCGVSCATHHRSNLPYRDYDRLQQEAVRSLCAVREERQRSQKAAS